MAAVTKRRFTRGPVVFLDVCLGDVGLHVLPAKEKIILNAHRFKGKVVKC